MKFVTIVDDKNTEALLPQEAFQPTGVEVIEEEKPVTYDPNESDEVSEVDVKK